MKEMKSLKEKEQKETKALEEMVQKVEENLATANVRKYSTSFFVVIIITPVHV